MSQFSIFELYVVYISGDAWSCASLNTDTVFTDKDEAQKHADNSFEASKNAIFGNTVKLSYHVTTLDDWFSIVESKAKDQERNQDIRR